MASKVRQYGTFLEANNTYVSCNFCSKTVYGFTRLKHHLAATGHDVTACTLVSQQVRQEMHQDILLKKEKKLKKQIGIEIHSEKPPKKARFVEDKHLHVSELMSSSTTEETEEIDAARLVTATAIGRFLHEAGVDLDAANLASFKEMVNAIADLAGVQVVIPNYNFLEGPCLWNEVAEVRTRIEALRSSWNQNGCSVILERWNCHPKTTIMRVLVDCQDGVCFLKSMDISKLLHNVDALAMAVKKIVSDIGEKNVLQIITDASSTQLAVVATLARKKLTSVSHSICADSCIDLILGKFERTLDAQMVLRKAQQIISFIYRNESLLQLMYAHLGGRELISSSSLVFVAQFVTLRNIVFNKGVLIDMFSSLEWIGMDITNLVMYDNEFWDNAEEILKIANPLIDVLHQLDRHKLPMANIYNGVDEAKLLIKGNLGNSMEKYQPAWAIIDDLWNKKLHSHLHAVGYYLNPTIFCDEDKQKFDKGLLVGLMDCVIGMVPSQDTQLNILREIELYEEKAMAKVISKPLEWWELQRDELPILQQVAGRILNQTCSGASRYNLDRNFTKQLHTMRRSCVEQQRFQDRELVYNNRHLWRHVPDVEGTTGAHGGKAIALGHWLTSEEA